MTKYILVLIIGVSLLNSCKQISPLCEDTDFTYNDEVKIIIDANCSTSGCHDQNATIGDFSSYIELEKYLNNGKFKKHVFTLGDMPKGFDLSFNDKAVLQCWMENNFLEN